MYMYNSYMYIYIYTHCIYYMTIYIIYTIYIHIYK